MSRWREVLAATPMRLTLRLAALFTAVSLGSFLLTWWMANRALLDATEVFLEQEVAELSLSGQPDQIAQAVRHLAETVDPDHLIVQYNTPAGMIGNYAGPLPDDDLRQADLEDEAQDIDGTYLLHSEVVAGGRLTVGQSDERFEELREIFSRVLLFTMVPTLLLVLAGGMLIALRSTRRLAAIESTLARLTDGDLTARLPVLRGPADDLSRVGAGIDRLAAAQEASVEALRQVSADIAHDLKTPIQRLAVLLDQARADAPHLDILDRAGAEINGITATFQALLRIAQIEGGSARARFAPVDLGALARVMADLYDPAAEETGHHLTLTLRDPATVPGDRALLGQAIANLIENALRHSPPGPVTLTVDHAAITVTDRGPGIPKAEHGKVLRRLYRLDRSRSTPGNGLGLALVDAVVKLHGGRLEMADNAPGLRVTVRLDAPIAGQG